MAEGPRRRLRLLGIVLVGLVFVLVAQLVQVQIINHGFYAAWAQEQQRQFVIIVEPPRGVIRDANGHLLAGNSVMYSIEADTRYVRDVEATATELGLHLHMPAAEIERTLREIESDENVDIDELADRVERASELIQFCLGRLEQAELRVRKVTEKLSRATGTPEDE